MFLPRDLSVALTFCLWKSENHYISQCLQWIFLMNLTLVALQHQAIHLNWSWLTISETLWHSSEDSFNGNDQDIHLSYIVWKSLVENYSHISQGIRSKTLAVLNLCDPVIIKSRFTPFHSNESLQVGEIHYKPKCRQSISWQLMT